MLDWYRQLKRPIMGWIGLIGLVAALIMPNVVMPIRIGAITLCLALICLALPSRTWTNVRGWWAD